MYRIKSLDQTRKKETPPNKQPHKTIPNNSYCSSLPVFNIKIKNRNSFPRRNYYLQNNTFKNQSINQKKNINMNIKAQCNNTNYNNSNSGNSGNFGNSKQNTNRSRMLTNILELKTPRYPSLQSTKQRQQQQQQQFIFKQQRNTLKPTINSQQNQMINRQSYHTRQQQQQQQHKYQCNNIYQQQRNQFIIRGDIPNWNNFQSFFRKRINNKSKIKLRTKML